MQYNHRTASRIHAVRRAWKRYGLALHVADLQNLEKLIWAGKAKWVADQANMTSLYRLRVSGQDAIVVFDIHLDCIKTFLPRGDRTYQAWLDRRRPPVLSQHQAI